MLRDFEASDYRLLSLVISHGSSTVLGVFGHCGLRIWLYRVAQKGHSFSVTANGHLGPKTAETGEVLLRTAAFPGSFQNLFATPTLSNWELYLLRSHRSGFETFSLQQRGWEVLQ